MTEPSNDQSDTGKNRSKLTKTQSVQRMLARAKGATLAEMTEATGWLPHSTRAFMTGLRKKGNDLVRECRTSGETCWRIER